MAKIDAEKERIAILKLLLTILFTTLVASIGWVFTDIAKSTRSDIWIHCIVGIFTILNLRVSGIVLKAINKKINLLEEL